MTFGTRRWWGCQPHAPQPSPPGNIPGTHFHWWLSRPQGHGTVGRNMSLKNPVKPPGIDPGTIRLVAQRLKHYATLGPICRLYTYIHVAAFNKKKTLFTSKMDLNLRKKLVKCYIWSMALYGAETWKLRAADQKYLESSEMWFWRRMEKISWTDHVRNGEVLVRINEQRNTLHEIRKRKANWIGHTYVETAF